MTDEVTSGELEEKQTLQTFHVLLDWINYKYIYSLQ